MEYVKHLGMNIFINRELTLKTIQRENKPRITDDSIISLFIFTLKGIVNQQMPKFNVTFLPSALKMNKKTIKSNDIIELCY